MFTVPMSFSMKNILMVAMGAERGAGDASAPVEKSAGDVPP